MKAAIKPVLEYLEEQKDIAEDALRAYDPQPIPDSDSEVRRMRELEAIKLRHQVSELRKYIATIKRMTPY